MAKPDKDYIGFDPIAWLDRLREVNRGSQFPEAAKTIINYELTIARDLVREALKGK
jgi:hypothetical protein